MTSPQPEPPRKKFPYQTFNIQIMMEENLPAEIAAVKSEIINLQNQLANHNEYLIFLGKIQFAASGDTPEIRSSEDQQ